MKRSSSRMSSDFNVCWASSLPTFRLGEPCLVQKCQKWGDKLARSVTLDCFHHRMGSILFLLNKKNRQPGYGFSFPTCSTSAKTTINECPSASYAHRIAFGDGTHFTVFEANEIQQWAHAQELTGIPTFPTLLKQRAHWNSRMPFWKFSYSAS